MGDLRQAIKLANKMCNRTERYFRRAKKDAKEIAVTIFEHIDYWRPKHRCFTTKNCYNLKEGPIKYITVHHIEKRVEVNAVVDAPADFSHNIFIYEEIRVRAAQHDLDIKVTLHTPNGKRVVSYP
ncbi:hypothetical protein ACCH40_002381 [Salmonella enterica]